MKTIFVCSPYSGDVDKNVAYAMGCCKYVTQQGHAPFAPHLLYPQFLSEETERHLGIDCGLAWLEKCDEMWVFGDKITKGMKIEITYATANHVYVKFVELD